MDTTTDYKALYLKKFFEWQEICGKQRAQIEELEKKLKIAIEVLEYYAHENSWFDCRNTYNDQIYRESFFFSQGYNEAQKALAKIKEIK